MINFLLWLVGSALVVNALIFKDPTNWAMASYGLILVVWSWLRRGEA